MHNIGVRETASYHYLTQNLKLSNVHLMADPAFTLEPQTVHPNEVWPQATQNGRLTNVLGINLSPLIERYADKNQNLQQHIGRFIQQVLDQTPFKVILIPHVSSLNTDNRNNCDHAYMHTLLQQFDFPPNRVKLLGSHYNAPQLKSIISQTRFFIGARTHATIAALSSATPTLSIAYSIKAKGINQDLFDHTKAMLDTPDLTQDTLWQSFLWLQSNETELINHLNRTILLHQQKVTQALSLLTPPNTNP
jgi:colanic acid/amylovoran biosynthesis protein